MGISTTVFCERVSFTVRKALRRFSATAILLGIVSALFFCAGWEILQTRKNSSASALGGRVDVSGGKAPWKGRAGERKAGGIDNHAHGGERRSRTVQLPSEPAGAGGIFRAHQGRRIRDGQSRTGGSDR